MVSIPLLNFLGYIFTELAFQYIILLIPASSCSYTVYCKLFKVEKFCGWTRYFKFAGKLSRFIHPGQKCAHVRMQFH